MTTIPSTLPRHLQQRFWIRLGQTADTFAVRSVASHRLYEIYQEHLAETGEPSEEGVVWTYDPPPDLPATLIDALERG